MEFISAIEIFHEHFNGNKEKKHMKEIDSNMHDDAPVNFSLYSHPFYRAPRQLHSSLNIVLKYRISNISGLRLFSLRAVRLQSVQISKIK